MTDLWEVAISILLGMLLGNWVFSAALNYCIRIGMMSVFVKGKSINRFSMWGPE